MSEQSSKIHVTNEPYKGTEQSVKASNAISVYLSPRANEVLKRYVENSGFGSVSRTVEEIILAYDKMYNNFLGSLATGDIQTLFKNPMAMSMLFLMMITNFELSNGSPLEQKLGKEVLKMVTGAGNEVVR